MARCRWFLLSLTLTLILASSISASAQSLPLIIQIAPTANITTIVTALGGTLVDSIPGANTFLLNVPAVPAPQVASLLGIQWAELNNGVSIPNFALLAQVTVPGTVAPDWYKYQPSWQLIEAQNALAYSTGSGVVVADINSQVDNSHPALTGHLTSGYDFVATKPSGYVAINQSDTSFVDQSDTSFVDQSDTSFVDQYGGVLSKVGLNTVNPAYSHGTLCAGVIAAIAPGAMIMPLRTFDNNGQADLFVLAKAIRWAVEHGAQVINMSFGTLTNSHAIVSAINYAGNSNVVLVASAGNNNTSNPQYPAAYTGVLGSAATTLSDQKASFSNYGSQVFVDAPGVDIISAYPGGNYSIVSGTSFSAPAVAATAALVRSLQWTGVANAIAGGAVNINSANPNYVNQLGYGRIDVLHAVKPN